MLKIKKNIYIFPIKILITNNFFEKIKDAIFSWKSKDVIILF
jgi:hypothetical protein